MAFKIRPRSKLLFIGDSITDCGRMADKPPLGDGYVSQIRDLIVAKHTKHQLEIINKGISGDTTLDLTNRWTDDVVAHQPDWLSIKVGINDAIRWARRDPDRAISPQEFEAYYDALLSRTKAETNSQIILVTPFFLSRDNTSDSWRRDIMRLLPKYVKVVHAMAQKYDTHLVRTHSRFQKLLKRMDTNHFCNEPIHPNASGHMVITQAWLEALDW